MKDGLIYEIIKKDEKTYLKVAENLSRQNFSNFQMTSLLKIKKLL